MFSNKQIKLLLSDCDGVLTDTGVYYSERGQEMKRFSIRDGMGIQRLREKTQISVGFVTGESTPILLRRAEKLGITEVHLGIQDKASYVLDLCQKKHLSIEEVAYIGDDWNDYDLLKIVGLSACPSDGIKDIRDIVDFICPSPGGYGALRDFCEYLITKRLERL